MSMDTVIYEKNSSAVGIALIENNNVTELEILAGNQALCGNVYLAKIN